MAQRQPWNDKLASELADAFIHYPGGKGQTWPTCQMPPVMNLGVVPHWSLSPEGGQMATHEVAYHQH